jgi:hypothetical protein
LIDVRSRADAELAFWTNMERSNAGVGGIRSSIKASMNSLRQYVSAADQALRAGDTAGARRYLDAADKQIASLQLDRDN